MVVRGSGSGSGSGGGAGSMVVAEEVRGAAVGAEVGGAEVRVGVGGVGVGVGVGVVGTGVAVAVVVAGKWSHKLFLHRHRWPLRIRRKQRELSPARSVSTCFNTTICFWAFPGSYAFIKLSYMTDITESHQTGDRRFCSRRQLSDLGLTMPNPLSFDARRTY